MYANATTKPNGSSSPSPLCSSLSCSSGPRYGKATSNFDDCIYQNVKSYPPLVILHLPPSRSFSEAGSIAGRCAGTHCTSIFIQRTFVMQSSWHQNSNIMSPFESCFIVGYPNFKLLSSCALLAPPRIPESAPNHNGVSSRLIHFSPFSVANVPQSPGWSFLR